MTAIEKAWREYVVYLAQSYIGCKESDGSHKKIIDLYNSHKPLARGYTLKYTDSWCSGFVSAIAIQAGLTDIIPTEVGCEKHTLLFKNHDKSKWEEDGTITPQMGDYIFYNWDSSVQPNDGGADHVGIVESVNNGRITVIEGNYSDSVKRRSLIVGNGNIRGYGLPAYDILTSMPPSYTRDESTTSTTALLQKGSTGDAVRNLQNNLISLGYSCGSAGADGDFGSGTEAAVRAFQKAKGITIDGIAGPVTLAAIQTALEDASKTTISTNTKRKYTESNPPFICMQTHSTCYKGTKKMTIKGVLWHSTGANNTNLKRYVQPYEGDTNYNEALAKLGTNLNKNDWNHIERQAGLNAWVGKMGDGTVGCVQSMPWDYRPWGCGSGSKGSCNDGWIQFEICEDALTDKTYLELVYEEACQLTAYLCEKYNIDPNGTVSHGGVNVPTILCHADSCALGLGSNHGDINHWFPKFGKSMATVRADVAELLNKKQTTTTVITNTTTTVTNLYRIRKSWNEARTQMGAYSNLENAKKACDKLGGDYKVFDNKGDVVYTPAEPFKPYIIRATSKLNVRQKPTNSSKIVAVAEKGAYTIIAEENGFGQLKSKVGWIDLSYVSKLTQ